MRIAYVTERKGRFYSGALAKVNVRKETEKSLMIEGKWEEVIPHVYYLPSRLDKSRYGTFYSLSDALRALISEQGESIVSLESSLARARAKLEHLQSMLTEVDTNEC